MVPLCGGKTFHPRGSSLLCPLLSPSHGVKLHAARGSSESLWVGWNGLGWGGVRSAAFSPLQALVICEPRLQPGITTSWAPSHQAQQGQGPTGPVRPLPTHPSSSTSDGYSPNRLRAVGGRLGTWPLSAGVLEVTQGTVPQAVAWWPGLICSHVVLGWGWAGHQGAA